MVTVLRGRRAVVAKLGMDAHWRGAIVAANTLRDAGMEVIYLGHATPAELASVVVDEDPDLVGLSSLSGNHLTECARVLAALADAGVHDVPVVLGGTVPPKDAEPLATLGIAAIFGTGTSSDAIVSRVQDLLVHRDAHHA